MFCIFGTYAINTGYKRVCIGTISTVFGFFTLFGNNFCDNKSKSLLEISHSLIEFRQEALLIFQDRDETPTKLHYRESESQSH